MRNRVNRLFCNLSGFALVMIVLAGGCAPRQPEVYVIYQTPTPTPTPVPRTIYVTPAPPKKAPVGISGDSPAGFDAVTRPQSYSSP